MQIVKVEPLAKINAIFSERAGTGEYNIDGFDTRDIEEGQKRKGSIGVRARGRLALFIESSLRNCEHHYGIVCGARESIALDLFSSAEYIMQDNHGSKYISFSLSIKCIAIIPHQPRHYFSALLRFTMHRI